MKKQNQALARALKGHGLVLRNSVGHGASIHLAHTGQCVAKVHLEHDNDVTRALGLLRRRGLIEKKD